MKFRVEQSIELRGDVIVFVRKLDESDFVLSENPRLAGVGVRRQVSQPRALTADGTPDLAVFAFHLVAAGDRSRLTIGQIVELT